MFTHFRSFLLCSLPSLLLCLHTRFLPFYDRLNKLGTCIFHSQNVESVSWLKQLACFDGNPIPTCLTTLCHSAQMAAHRAIKDGAGGGGSYPPSPVILPGLNHSLTNTSGLGSAPLLAKPSALDALQALIQKHQATPGVLRQSVSFHLIRWMACKMVSFEWFAVVSGCNNRRRRLYGFKYAFEASIMSD